MSWPARRSTCGPTTRRGRATRGRRAAAGCAPTGRGLGERDRDRQRCGGGLGGPARRCRVRRADHRGDGRPGRVPRPALAASAADLPLTACSRRRQLGELAGRAARRSPRRPGHGVERAPVDDARARCWPRAGPRADRRAHRGHVHDPSARGFDVHSYPRLLPTGTPSGCDACCARRSRRWRPAGVLIDHDATSTRTSAGRGRSPSLGAADPLHPASAGRWPTERAGEEVGSVQVRPPPAAGDRSVLLAASRRRSCVLLRDAAPPEVQRATFAGLEARPIDHGLRARDAHHHRPRGRRDQRQRSAHRCCAVRHAGRRTFPAPRSDHDDELDGRDESEVDDYTRVGVTSAPGATAWVTCSTRPIRADSSLLSRGGREQTVCVRRSRRSRTAARPAPRRTPRGRAAAGSGRPAPAPSG